MGGWGVGFVLAARQGSLGRSTCAVLLSHQSAIVACLPSLLFYYVDTFISYVEAGVPSHKT